MTPRPRERRRTNVPPDSIPDEADALPDDLRRRDQPVTPPDSLPETPEEEAPPVAGHSPAPDGGVDQHPVHDEPVEDFTPDDYEQQIEDVARDLRRTENDDKPVADRD